ncbi:MAG: hypothetical protein ACREON_08625 [Gemmatimonadaceae bacterium]
MSTPRVCVIPAAGTSAVDIATVVDGKITARERIDATGEQRVSSRDGCTGWERAEWSPDGRRVYLRSEHACSGGVKRTSSGVFSMSAAGEWLDVQGVTSGEHTGVRVARYLEAGYPDALPTEIAAALRDHVPSASAARTVAMSPLTTTDVVEASRHLDPAVVEAWLIEREQGFDIDAKRLVALADAGLPERVIDVMVALSYPKAFAINRATRQGEIRPAEGVRGDGDTYESGRRVGPIYTSSDPFGYSSCSWSYYSWYGYSPYGCGGYGYGYGYGWYPGDNPVVIIVRPEDGEAERRGRVVKGRGYTRGDRESEPSSGSDVNATRRSGGSSGSSTSGSSTSDRAHSPSSGSSAGSDRGSGRTAKPRSP